MSLIAFFILFCRSAAVIPSGGSYRSGGYSSGGGQRGGASLGAVGTDRSLGIDSTDTSYGGETSTGSAGYIRIDF
jgi:hypothetical protein